MKRHERPGEKRKQKQWRNLPALVMMYGISGLRACCRSETRKRLVRAVREFAPDVIFCSRPNDYHADHRNSPLVQDASYLLIRA